MEMGLERSVTNRAFMVMAPKQHNSLHSGSFHLCHFYLKKNIVNRNEWLVRISHKKLLKSSEVYLNYLLKSYIWITAVYSISAMHTEGVESSGEEGTWRHKRAPRHLPSGHKTWSYPQGATINNSYQNRRY